MIGNRLEMLFFIVTLKTSNLVSVSMRVSGWRVEPRRAQKTKEKTRKEQEREKKGEDNFVFFINKFQRFHLEKLSVLGRQSLALVFGRFKLNFSFSHIIFLS